MSVAQNGSYLQVCTLSTKNLMCNHCALDQIVGKLLVKIKHKSVSHPQIYD